MESSVEETSSAVLGPGVARKTKSLDLDSIYKSEGLPNKAVQNGGGDDNKKKKKKRKKTGKDDFGLEPALKKSRKTVDERSDPGRDLSGLSNKIGLNGLALTLGGSGNVISVPRRPRGFVGRKKGEGNGSVKPNGTCCQGGKPNGVLKKIGSPTSCSEAQPVSNGNISKLLGSVGGSVGGSKAKRKRNVRKAKEGGAAGEVAESGKAGQVKGSWSVGEAEERKDGGEGEGGKDGGEVKETKDGGEVKEIKGAAEVKKSNNGGEGKENESENGGVVKERKNVGKLKPRKNAGKLKERKNAGEVKEKKKAGEVKEIKNNIKSSSSQNSKQEDGDHDINNGSSSFRKRQRKRKKRTDLASCSESVQKKEEFSLGIPRVALDDFQDDDDDDDEEKLEQNAARMLSSRFDPRCTGYTSNSENSGRQSGNAISVSQSSINRGEDSTRNSRSKDASRVLRPRKQLKDRGHSRKRRHFYEIGMNNLDALWFLNRRIKVFWPLDESWYYGLVNDYNPDIKLHHVKYDDRDEEWVDLHTEKFKLLLLPSEVPGRGEDRKSSRPEKYWDKRKIDNAGDVSYDGSYLDSEPIISWLPRSSRRVKSSPSSHLEEQKTLPLSPSVMSRALPFRTDDKHGDVAAFTGDGNKSDSDFAFPDKSSDGERVKTSLLGNPSSSKNSKPVVYVRRRLNKRRKELSSVCVNDEAVGSHPKIKFSPAVDDKFLFFVEYDASHRCLEFDKLLWALDDQGLLRLRVPLVESKSFKVGVCLPILPFLSYSGLSDHLEFSHLLLPPHNGSIMTAWPEVTLEMLFVDNIIGLRFVLFEGGLNLAVEILAFILTVFNQAPGDWKFFDVELPVTSIRFKFSNTHDLRRQKEFAFYSFSKLNRSKWLYLDTKLQRHCLLSKQLPISECTYDNIKTLEHENYQVDIPARGPGFFPVKKRLMRGILPLGVARGASKRIAKSAVHSTSKSSQIPTFALSFAAAPTFFLSLHLKLLMEHNFACISLQDDTSHRTFEDAVFSISPQIESCQENILEECDKDATKSAQDLDYEKFSTVVDSSNSKDLELATAGRVVDPLEGESHNQEAGRTGVASVAFGSYSSFGSLSIELPSCNLIDKPVDAEVNISKQVSDLTWSTSDGQAQSPHQTSLRSSWCLDRSHSRSPLKDLSPLWGDGKSILIGNGFGSGPKKPRTRVRYSLPGGGYDSHSRYTSLNQRSFTYKRIRRSNEKKKSDGLIGSQKDLEKMSCDANILVTLRDKGWRECGALIVLELMDQSEWRLAVKVSGITKYSHKVDHVLQPGSTNRFTHAMMWKGGKDWVLEFPDRNQWVIFKEMHEECHNRNIRAASVKNIPIPGVRLIQEPDDYMADVLFFKNSSMYFRQVESDVEMAMNPLRILYDMDSDDEEWISKKGKSLGGENIFQEISCELFEKVVDILEKYAYSHQCDHIRVEELEGLMAGICTFEIMKGIYEHWLDKRQRKGMSLIRHFQPPLWEIYQQQVKVWEQTVARTTAASFVECKEKNLLHEKPAMFAFCLKPRGLEVPNKGSKQRSHRRFSVSAHSQVFDQDGLHTFVPGRRLNGFAVGEEKTLFLNNGHEFSDSSPSLHASSRVFSPRDPGGFGLFSLNSDVPEWNQYPRYHGNKQKKSGAFMSPTSMKSVHRTVGVRNGVHRWNVDLPEWPCPKLCFEGSPRHGIEPLDGSDHPEYRLRDASGAAQHALNMAKLKRENAKRLLYKADLAIHKAVVALMTAEAKREALDKSNGDG